MVVVTVDNDLELAIYRDLEVKAPKGQAIKKLIEIITKN